MKSRMDLRTQRKGNQGITLMALVITIIVLLILAAVSIVTLTRENGILRKSKYSKRRKQKGRIQRDIRINRKWT